MSDADTHVVIVLTDPSRINIQIRHSGVEITRCEAYARVVPKPYIQPGSGLNYSCIGAGGARIRSVVVVIERRRLSEPAISIASAHPWSNRVSARIFTRTEGVAKTAPMSLGIPPG